MKKANKRGFTIVELVIVIAVIAILAAVLIPTFSGLIKKANLSNDKSFVRNMNTTLAAEGALEKFNSAGDAIDALNRNGFMGKYNTYSTNFHYCYSLENNRMYLLDDNNVVVYPEEEVAVSSLWGLYMDSRTSVTAGVTKYVAMTNITNSAHYNDVFASGTYTIDLNGYFIAVDSTVSGVTASNGIVISGANSGDGVNTGYEIVESDEESISASLLFEYAELVDGTYVIKDKIFTKHLYPGNLTTNNLKFENCIFYGCGMNVGDASGYSDGRKVIYENCQFTDTNGDAWAILVYGSVDVIDCTFTNVKHGAIQIHDDSEDIKVKISGCTFDGLSEDEYPLIRFVGKHYPAETGYISSLEISDCEFIALNKSVGIIGFSGEGSSLYNYTGAADQATVTFSNNKFGDAINGKYLVSEGNYAAGAGNTLGSLLGDSAK